MADGYNNEKYKMRWISKKGNGHLNNCDDAVSVFVKDNTAYLGVFDGCSGGQKSYFAAELHAKLFKKAAKLANSQSLEYQSHEILNMMRRDLSLFKSIYEISSVELLSTVIFAIIDTNTKAGIILSAGDGVIICNEKINIIDQNNLPVYLIEHELDNNNNFIDQFCSIQKFDSISDLTISTDGILTFKSKEKLDQVDFVIDYFCKDQTLLNSLAMLPRKYNMLISKNYIHEDDLSMIRILF